MNGIQVNSLKTTAIIPISLDYDTIQWLPLLLLLVRVETKLILWFILPPWLLPTS